MIAEDFTDDASVPSNSGAYPSEGASIPRGWFASGGAPGGFGGPVETVDIDVDQPIPDLLPGQLPDGSSYSAVQVLVRLHRTPIGMVLLSSSEADPATGSIDRGRVASHIWAELGQSLADHVVADGQSPPVILTPAGLPGADAALCSWQSRLGRHRPTATICIATCGRSIPGLLRVVRSALDQTYDDTQVLVVDNRPGSSELPGPLIEAFGHEDRLWYVTEPKPGLASVRNRSSREAQTEIVALTDEDVTLDSDWLGFLVAGFDRPEVACVTGLILPSHLETRAQHLIEEFGGFSKGFERRRWDLGSHRLDHPVYPYLLGIYGSGANAAWRRSLLAELGGYDDRLGTGTRTRGGEDLDIYLTCIRGGHQLVYEPAALVRHDHRREIDLLRRQVFDYGVGLGAVITKHFLSRDERRDMLSRLPAAVDYLLSPTSPKNVGKTSQFPRSLTLAELVGIGYGSVAFLRSQRRP